MIGKFKIHVLKFSGFFLLLYSCSNSNSDVEYKNSIVKSTTQHLFNDSLKLKLIINQLSNLVVDSNSIWIENRLRSNHLQYYTIGGNSELFYINNEKYLTKDTLDPLLVKGINLYTINMTKDKKIFEFSYLENMGSQYNVILLYSVYDSLKLNHYNGKTLIVDEKITNNWYVLAY